MSKWEKISKEIHSRTEPLQLERGTRNVYTGLALLIWPGLHHGFLHISKVFATCLLVSLGMGQLNALQIHGRSFALNLDTQLWLPLTTATRIL